MLANALNAYTNLGSRRCTCEPNFAAGAGLTIERQHVSPRFPRQVEPTTAADTLKIVLLGDEVSFDCAVESADVTEVSIWWQKDEANLTISDEEKYSLKVTVEELLFSIFFWQKFHFEKNTHTLYMSNCKNALCLFTGLLKSTKFCLFFKYV